MISHRQTTKELLKITTTNQRTSVCVELVPLKNQHRTHQLLSFAEVQFWDVSAPVQRSVDQHGTLSETKLVILGVAN